MSLLLPTNNINKESVTTFTWHDTMSFLEAGTCVAWGGKRETKEELFFYREMCMMFYLKATNWAFEQGRQANEHGCRRRLRRSKKAAFAELSRRQAAKRV